MNAVEMFAACRDHQASTDDATENAVMSEVYAVLRAAVIGMLHYEITPAVQEVRGEEEMGNGHTVVTGMGP